MKKLVCRAASALCLAALLTAAPLGSVHADDTAAVASDVDFDTLMAEVAASAGDAASVQQAAEEAYNASLAIGNSAEISSIIANQTIVNLAFVAADSDEEIENARTAALLLEQQSSEEGQRMAATAQAAAEASQEAAKAAAQEAANDAAAAAAAAQTAESSASQASDSDRKLLAAIIYCEAGNQSMQGKIAVGNVVLNRVKSSKFPNTISKVIYQKGQFTPAGSGWLKKVLRKDNIPESCYEAADRALAGERPVGNAVFFMRSYLHSSGIIIGAHCFWGSM
ncbi:MAG: cell wall hydrolase [Lachnospiraceae bacterium]